MTDIKPAEFLISLFRTAVDSACAENCLPPYLASLPHKKVCVLGAGKAAAAMAETIESELESEVYGLVVTRYDHALPLSSIEVVEAAHPVPDERGVSAAKRIVNLAAALSEDDFAICAISGGASSLLSLPHPKIAFEEKQKITRQLLLAGASIQEINCVRKHLSAIKGGRLMSRIAPARALTLCISDVVGDDPSVIGSGPTVADSSTCDDVLGVISRFRVTVPQYIQDLLRQGELETPKPSDPIFKHSEFQIVAKPLDALQASAIAAESLGVRTFALGDAVAGDTNQVAKRHAELMKHKLAQASKEQPFVILSGGETTVKVTGSGKGGPNTQYALAMALELAGIEDVYGIACDTDGIDGSETNAGALFTPTTLKRACMNDLDAREYLKNNDAYGFFDQLGDLVMTGPTLTNVNDFRAVAYLPGFG